MDIIVHFQEATDGGHAPMATALPHAVSTHSLRQDEFDALGAGYGSADTVVRLGEAQQSLRRSLLARVAETAPSKNAVFARAWDLLATLDETHPAEVSAVLAHPYVRVWAVQCLSAPESDPDESNPTSESDAASDSDTASESDTASPHFAHLGAIAASAALRAGVGAELALPVFGCAVHLPGLGALALDSDVDAAAAEIREDGSMTVRTSDSVHEVLAHEPQPAAASAEHTNPLWHPLRTLTAEALTVALDDTDPYRGCHGDPADRLADDEFQRWNAEFRAALAFIDAHLPAYAPGLRAGLTTIMPMVRRGDGTHRSAAARHAFGAIGAARPGDPAILALLLVHEFQHVKLGAILDLFDLYDTNDTEARHYAPWRPDPRPLEGLLQGTYAHIAVSEFWRVRRLSPGATAADEAQFARWRLHTHEAVDELLASGSLTPLGERFVRAMGETAAAWLAEPVGAEALDVAHLAAREHRDAFDLAIRTMR